MVRTICDLTSGVFEYLEITSTTDVDQIVTYTECIMRGEALKKYKAVLLEYKKLEEYLAGDKWTLGELKGISTEDFWTWDKSDRLAYDGDA